MFGKKSSPKGAETKAAAAAHTAAGKSEAKPAAAKRKEKKSLTIPFLGKKKVRASAEKTGAKADGKHEEGKPPARPEGKPPEGTPPEGAHRAKAPAKPTAKKGGSPLKLLLPVFLLLAVGGGVYYAYTHFLGGGGAKAPAAVTSAPVPTQALSNPQTSLTEGDAASSAKPPPKRKAVSCDGTPKFFAKLKLPKSAVFSTNEPNTRGLVLLAPIENSDAVSKYQHQSWNRAGFMDAFAIDQNGNVYVVPSPRTGLGVTKPTKQDHLFKVDTNSGELQDMLTLPSVAPTSAENPYGVLGLALDCDTNSLYVTTVTGSTDAKQVGRIFRVDLTSGDMAGQKDNMDGYGVAVRSAAGGKQLVFGSARDGKIRAIDLDASGNFKGEPREIAALAGTKRARAISFSSENGMVVQAVDFVLSKTEIPQGNNVNFQYDAASDKWTAAP